MARRVRGYHYVRMANGRKKRVYGRRVARRGARSYRPKRTTYRGHGAYRKASGRGRSKGMGQYVYNQRSRRNGNLEGDVPRISNSKTGGRVNIQHTEYIGDVLSSEAFQNNTFTLNPGLSLAEGGFTNWLFNVAQNFEEWLPRGICFHFKSTSAEYSNATGAALGTVSLATQYNVLNSTFTSKVNMENYEGASSTKPSKNMNHFVECENRQTPVHPMYIRTAPVPAGADARLYDLGIFQIATSGMNSVGVTVGELWLSYDIDFLKPRIDPQIGGIFDHFQIAANANNLPATPFGIATNGLLFPTTDSTAGGAVSGGIVPAANCLASTTTATRDNFEGGVPTAAGGGTLGPTSANTYYFPPSAPIGSIWMFQYLGQGFTAGNSAASTFTVEECTGANLLNVNTNSNLSQVGTASTTLIATVFVKIIGPFANIVFTNAGAQANNGGAQLADLWVFQLGQPVN